MLISHNHYDHLDKKSVSHFKNKTTNFLVPLGVKKILVKWGIDEKKIIELNWYDSYKTDVITYHATPSRHFSGRGIFDRNKTLWVSWVMEHKNEKIFFSGDSGYGSHYKEIHNHFGSFDLAFLENGQYDRRWSDIHMLPGETVQSAIDLKAKAFVPIHWGMFDLSLHKWSEPVENSYAIAKKNHISIIVPKLGEIFFKDSHKNKTFWLKAFK